jgi:Ca2+-binding RTX toxin-like protein
MSADIFWSSSSYNKFGFSAGNISTLDLELTNWGDTSAGAFSVKAYISLDNQIGSGDYVVLDHRISGLGVSETFGVMANVALPLNIVGGQYYILLQIDYFNEVAEGAGEGNNFDIIAAPEPDWNITIADSSSRPLDTTSAIFAAYGQMSFLAKLAMASYHLIGETIGDKVNDVKGPAQYSYGFVTHSLQPLTAVELPTLSMTSVGGDFGAIGIRNGIFTGENAAAFVARSQDALFLSFRGTNDNDGEAGGLINTPDEHDWIGKGAHLDHFLRLFVALDAYVRDPANGIHTIYVIGHSLGGGMVEGFMDLYPTLFAGVTVHASTFASSGFGAAIGSEDARIGNLWLDGDPILAASKVGDNEGDENVIYHNLGANGFLHSMGLYIQFVDFMRDNGIDEKQLSQSGLHGIDYDSFFINAVANFDATVFSIGTQADSIVGFSVSDVILGGNANDSLFGGGGRDHIVGGSDNDSLDGGAGGDFLYGGIGRDTLVGGANSDLLMGGAGADRFVYKSSAELGAAATATDKLGDFSAAQGDRVDLAAIDANVSVVLDQSFRFISGEFSVPNAGDLRASTDTKGNTVVYGYTDADVFADFCIVFNGAVALTAFSFYL